MTVEVTYNRPLKQITIEDNSIGMKKEDLIAALRVAHPTKDSRGRSRYGMGMKTAACWLGSKWQVVTTEWGSDEEWTATVTVADVVAGKKVPMTKRTVGVDEHYTKVIITDLHRYIQKRSEETLINYLGSMYRFDLADGSLKLLFNGVAVPGPEALEFDTDAVGAPMKRPIPETLINGKKVSGWVAVLRRGGRKFGGFSIFQERRQIKGYPNAWKPRNIFGGEDDEGANNLVAQRLTGEINLDPAFKVSHTKDAIVYDGDEEEELEKLLDELTKDYRNYAARRRNAPKQPWAREKLRDFLDSVQKEFTSAELGDALTSSNLPPHDALVKNNQAQVAALAEGDILANFQLPGLLVRVAVREVSEFEPYVTIQAAAQAGVIYVIVNGLHPYYCAIEAPDVVEECLRQYVYDAIAEYRTQQLTSRIAADSVRRIKSDLLRAPIQRAENAAAQEREGGSSPASAGAAGSAPSVSAPVATVVARPDPTGASAALAPKRD